MFPNQFNVYLHDTPADSLFARASRSFSHGCVRLEQPEKLAEYVLRDQPEWTPERITEAMHGGEERTVRLKAAAPGVPRLLDRERVARSAGAVPQGRLRDRRPAHDQARRAAAAAGERRAMAAASAADDRADRSASPSSRDRNPRTLELYGRQNCVTRRAVRRDRRAWTDRRPRESSRCGHGRRPTPR